MKAIFYKEWLKTRWYLLLAAVVTLGTTGYSLMRIARVADMKGIAHVWEVMLSRDAVFVDSLEYLPLLAGAVLALVQFMPEMYHKCLKLTLHLPCEPIRMITLMTAFGTAALAAIFAAASLTMFIYLRGILAPELYGRILLTAAPWFLAGIAGYLTVAWICLEPAWKRRVADIAVAVPLLWIYFLAPAPAAYGAFLPVLAVFTLLTATLSWLSAARFKEGKQD